MIFPGLAVEALQQRVAAVSIHVAGRRIADGAGPADALGRHVGQIHIVRLPPDDFARVGVEAENFFLLVARAGLEAIDRVNFAAHHDGRRDAAGLVVLPEHVLARVRIPVVDQASFAGDAVLFRPAPHRPIQRIAGDRGSCFGWLGVSRLGVNRLGVNRLGVNRLGVGRLGVGRFGVGRFGVGRFGVGRFGVGRFGVGRFGVGRFGFNRSRFRRFGVCGLRIGRLGIRRLGIVWLCVRGRRLVVVRTRAATAEPAESERRRSQQSIERGEKTDA